MFAGSETALLRPFLARRFFLVFVGFGKRDGLLSRFVGGGVLEFGAEPADQAALFFGRSFGVEGDQPFQNLFIGERDRPAVGVEHGGVEFVVKLFENRDQPLLVNRLLFVVERFAGAELFEHVVHAGHGQPRMGRLLPLPMRAKLLQQFGKLKAKVLRLEFERLVLCVAGLVMRIVFVAEHSRSATSYHSKSK